MSPDPLPASESAPDSAPAGALPGALGHRGRGRPAGPSSTRAVILDAALALFSERGYARVTVRDIADAAGVDPALVSRSLGGKRELFVTTVVEHSHVAEQLLDALEGDRGGVGERLTRGYLGLWEAAPTQRILVALVRASLGEAEALASELFLATEASVAPALAERGTLALQGYAVDGVRVAMAELFGVAVARHVLGVPTLADVALDDLVSCLAPSVQRMITEGLPGH